MVILKILVKKLKGPVMEAITNAVRVDEKPLDNVPDMETGGGTSPGVLDVNVVPAAIPAPVAVPVAALVAAAVVEAETAAPSISPIFLAPPTLPRDPYQKHERSNKSYRRQHSWESCQHHRSKNHRHHKHRRSQSDEHQRYRRSRSWSRETPLRNNEESKYARAEVKCQHCGHKNNQTPPPTPSPSPSPTPTPSPKFRPISAPLAIPDSVVVIGQCEIWNALTI
jgi:hypothetical protein